MLKYAYLIYYIQGTAILVFSHSSLDTKMRQNIVDDRKWKNDMGLSFAFYLKNLEKNKTVRFYIKTYQSETMSLFLTRVVLSLKI